MMNEEILDNQLIKKHQAEISISHGMSFSLRVVILAVFLTFVGLGMLVSGGIGYFIGPLLLVGCGFAITSFNGVDISLSSKHIRDYYKRFGMKTGKWIPMDAFPDVVIIKLGKTKRASDISGMISTNIDASKNEVFLMTHDHRRRFLLKTCKSYQEAVKFSEEMAKTLEKNIAKFSPKLSEQTKRRLQFRK